MNLTFRFTLIVFLSIFLYLQYVLWFEDAGILDMISLRQQLSHQLTENDKLKKQNDELFEQVVRLKKDPHVVEGKARGELGMIKKGEYFYQIVEKK